MQPPQWLQRGTRVEVAAVAAGAICVLGFALRVAGLRRFWNHADEGIYYHIAHAPIEIASGLIANNAHPPLYYHLLRAVAAFTDDFFWLRVPALLFGTLAIYALYRVGSRLAGPVCGIASAALLAVSPGAIALSQVARPYALVLLLVIGALGSLLRYFDERNVRALWFYTAWMIAAGFVHYSAFLAFAGFGVAISVAAVVGRFHSAEIRDLAIANAVVAAVAGAMFATHVQPVLLNSAMQAEALGAWLGDQFSTAPGALWSNFLGVFDYLAGPEFAGVAALVFLVSIAVSLGWQRYAPIGICVGVIGVGVLASAASLYPFGGTRHSVYLAPFLALPLGLGAALACSMGARVAIASLALLVLLGVAREPIAEQMGLSETRMPPEPEFAIPVAELEALRDPLDTIESTPGLLFMDLSTLYTLLPMVGTAATQTSWSAGSDHSFGWGARRVVVIPHWQIAADESSSGQPNHLWTHIRRVRNDPKFAELMERDVSVISADARRVPVAIRSLAVSRPERKRLIGNLTRTPHLSVFGLDVDQYQRSLRRAILDRAAQRAQNLELDTNESADAERANVEN